MPCSGYLQEVLEIRAVHCAILNCDSLSTGRDARSSDRSLRHLICRLPSYRKAHANTITENIFGCRSTYLLDQTLNPQTKDNMAKKKRVLKENGSRFLPLAQGQVMNVFPQFFCARRMPHRTLKSGVEPVPRIPMPNAIIRKKDKKKCAQKRAARQLTNLKR